MWAATEKNVRNQLKRHQYTEFREKITTYYNQFNTKKFARRRNKNSPPIFFSYQLSDTIVIKLSAIHTVDTKNWNLKSKKGLPD
jgi:hypothetical protein